MSTLSAGEDTPVRPVDAASGVLNDDPGLVLVVYSRFRLLGSSVGGGCRQTWKGKEKSLF